MPGIQINKQIAFTHPVVATGRSCPLLWDLRDPPSTAAQPVPSTSAPAHNVNINHKGHGQRQAPRPPHLLSEYATSPPISALRITCGLLPAMRMRAHNPCGVTVSDVLGAIHTALRVPLTHAEWGSLSAKQRARVQRAYETRCRTERERERGVRRVDCLLRYTRFAGVGVSFEDEFGGVLSLARNED